VFDIGLSDEGRQMIAAAIADSASIANLDAYRDVTRRLADPRGLSEGDARTLLSRGKPIYYLTGSIHSPETGSPEMLMELAYRLAVEDTPLFRSIRERVITVITPVSEVDGRDRMVDVSPSRDPRHPDILQLRSASIGQSSKRNMASLSLQMNPGNNYCPRLTHP